MYVGSASGSNTSLKEGLVSYSHFSSTLNRRLYTSEMVRKWFCQGRVREVAAGGSRQQSTASLPYKLLPCQRCGSSHTAADPSSLEAASRAPSLGRELDFAFFPFNSLAVYEGRELSAQCATRAVLAFTRGNIFFAQLKSMPLECLLPAINSPK